MTFDNTIEEGNLLKDIQGAPPAINNMSFRLSASRINMITGARLPVTSILPDAGVFRPCEA
jgi:hypothetical protein